MSVRSLLKLNKGNKIHLGSLKAIFVKVSQNFIKSHLKFCLISQISAHSLWHVCQQQGHTGTRPPFKVSSERPEKWGIDLAIPGLVV